MQFSIILIALCGLAVVGSFVYLFNPSLFFTKNTARFFDNKKYTTASDAESSSASLAANATTAMSVIKETNFLPPPPSSANNLPCTSRSAIENENPKNDSDLDKECSFGCDDKKVNTYYEHRKNWYNPDITQKTKLAAETLTSDMLPETLTSNMLSETLTSNILPETLTSNILPETNLPNIPNPPSPSASSYEIVSSQKSSSGSISPIRVINRSNSDSSFDTKPPTDKNNVISKNNPPVGNIFRRMLSEPILTIAPKVPIYKDMHRKTTEITSSTNDAESAEYNADDEKEEHLSTIRRRPLFNKPSASYLDDERNDNYYDSKADNSDAPVNSGADAANDSDPDAPVVSVNSAPDNNSMISNLLYYLPSLSF